MEDQDDLSWNGLTKQLCFDAIPYKLKDTMQNNKCIPLLSIAFKLRPFTLAFPSTGLLDAPFLLLQTNIFLLWHQIAIPIQINRNSSNEPKTAPAISPFDRPPGSNVKKKFKENCFPGEEKTI